MPASPLPAGLKRELELFRRHCLSTGTLQSPADRSATQQCVAAFYEILDLKVPRFEWTLSPKAAVLTLYELGNKRGPWLASRFEKSLRRPLWKAFDRALEDAPAEASRALHEASNAAGAILLSALRTTPGAALFDELGPPIGAGKDASWTAGQDSFLGEAMRQCFWGQQETYWAGAIVWAGAKLGVRLPPRLAPLTGLWVMLSLSCGWWWPCEKVCVVCDRPSLVKLGKDRKGGIVKYRDGWEAKGV